MRQIHGRSGGRSRYGSVCLSDILAKKRSNIEKIEKIVVINQDQKSENPVPRLYHPIFKEAHTSMMNAKVSHSKPNPTFMMLDCRQKTQKKDQACD